MGRLIDADKLYPDRMTNKDTVAISQSQIANVPTVEAIPKVDYENRLKADMVAMLEDFDLLIDEFDSGCGWDGYIKKIDVHEIIQQKINVLKGE